MFAKKILVASLFAAVGVSNFAYADDTALGAVVGGVLGAAIGHNINSHGGGVVGGVLGAVTGASIAANNDRYNAYRNDNYYGNGYPYQGSVSGAVVVGGPRYYAAPPVVYAPPPRVVYAPPRVVYGPPVVYAPRYENYGGYRGYDRHDRRDWRDDDRWHHHHGDD